MKKILVILFLLVATTGFSLTDAGLCKAIKSSIILGYLDVYTGDNHLPKILEIAENQPKEIQQLLFQGYNSGKKLGNNNRGKYPINEQTEKANQYSAIFYGKCINKLSE